MFVWLTCPPLAKLGISTEYQFSEWLQISWTRILWLDRIFRVPFQNIQSWQKSNPNICKSKLRPWEWAQGPQPPLAPSQCPVLLPAHPKKIFWIWCISCKTAIPTPQNAASPLHKPGGMLASWRKSSDPGALHRLWGCRRWKRTPGSTLVLYGMDTTFENHLLCDRGEQLNILHYNRSRKELKFWEEHTSQDWMGMSQLGHLGFLKYRH